MGIIVPFKARHHGRASKASRLATFREANSVKRSAVTPPALPVSESTIGFHHSSGMRSRCSHLRADARETPISSAIKPGEPQSPITARNESSEGVAAAMDVSVTEPSLGHIVLNGKAILSQDFEAVDRQTWPMGKAEDDPAISSYIKEFCARTRLARAARGWSQDELGGYLGMEQGSYQKYENRTCLRPWLIPKFCRLTGVTPDWLFLNKGRQPMRQEAPQEVTSSPSDLPKKRGRRKRTPKAA